MMKPHFKPPSSPPSPRNTFWNWSNFKCYEMILRYQPKIGQFPKTHISRPISKILIQHSNKNQVHLNSSLSCHTSAFPDLWYFLNFLWLMIKNINKPVLKCVDGIIIVTEQDYFYLQVEARYVKPLELMNWIGVYALNYNKWFLKYITYMFHSAQQCQHPHSLVCTCTTSTFLITHVCNASPVVWWRAT